MNTRQLECFCLIAENNSFSQTAAALYISQSAVTQQISALEKELGFRLFERTTKAVRLTSAGEVFRPYAENALQMLSRGNSLALAEWNRHESSFRIGCYDVTANRFMTKLLSLFLARYPDAAPTVQPMRPHQLLPKLKARKLDCCLMVAADVELRADQFDFIPLCRQRLYAVMDRAHPLAGEAELRPEQLRGYTARSMCALHGDFYTTLRVEQQLLEELRQDALPIELNDGQIELLRIKQSRLVITRPNYTLPDDDSLAFVPLVHDFMPEYGIAVLPDHKKIVEDFIRMAAGEDAHWVFDY